MLYIVYIVQKLPASFKGIYTIQLIRTSHVVKIGGIALWYNPMTTYSYKPSSFTFNCPETGMYEKSPIFAFWQYGPSHENHLGAYDNTCSTGTALLLRSAKEM